MGHFSIGGSIFYYSILTPGSLYYLTPVVPSYHYEFSIIILKIYLTLRCNEMDYKHTCDTIYTHFQSITDNIFVFCSFIFYATTTHPAIFLPSTTVFTHPNDRWTGLWIKLCCDYKLFTDNCRMGWPLLDTRASYYLLGRFTSPPLYLLVYWCILCNGYLFCIFFLYIYIFILLF